MPEIDPNHPITVESNPRRVTVTLNGFTIASTHLARTLREASYPPVQYIPRDDVQMNLLSARSITPIARTRAMRRTTRSWPAMCAPTTPSGRTNSPSPWRARWPAIWRSIRTR